MLSTECAIGLRDSSLWGRISSAVLRQRNLPGAGDTCRCLISRCIDEVLSHPRLPRRDSKSLNADHHTVCKFDDVEDSNYVSVRNALKTLVTTNCSTGKKREHESCI